MSRKRGRPQRQYRVRVRTVRREPIDFDALARAALEHAAMNQTSESETPATNQVDDAVTIPPQQHRHQHLKDHERSKEHRHDRLA